MSSLWVRNLQDLPLEFCLKLNGCVNLLMYILGTLLYLGTVGNTFGADGLLRNLARLSIEHEIF